MTRKAPKQKTIGVGWDRDTVRECIRIARKQAELAGKRKLASDADGDFIFYDGEETMAYRIITAIRRRFGMVKDTPTKRTRQ